MTREYSPPEERSGADERDEGTRRATLSRDLSEFLLDLSIGVHRYAMYPTGHPSLAPAAGNVLSRMARLLKDRKSLNIGVARRQLVIEGVATDQHHPVLADLARRLHAHQLGAMSFTRGAALDEVEGLLATLAQEPERGGHPIGLLPREDLPRWDHVRVFPVGYDQLELRGEEASVEEPDRATQLWLGLAQAAMADDEPPDPDSAPDEKTLARTIGSHQREAAYDQVIVGYLLQLAEELKSGDTNENQQVREKVSTLVQELDQETLQRLLTMGGSAKQRERFVLDANESLAVDSVVKILQAAAATEEQTISSSLTRMLGKLAMHAEKGPGRVPLQADAALREHIEELVNDWHLKDPNPDQYTMLLDQMAKAAPAFESADLAAEALREGAEGNGRLTGAERLLKMSLEVGAWGTTVEKAMAEMMEEGRTREMLGLVDEVGDENEVARRIRGEMSSPSQLRRILSRGDVNPTTLAEVVERVGGSAVGPLLDALCESESRAIRRKVFDLLIEMGPEVGEGVMERLEDDRWFVLRNLLALVQRLEPRPEGFDPVRFTDHPDARVRREAFPIAVQEGRQRQRVLAQGLSDPDERVLRMALLEVQKELPEILVPTVVNRVVLSDRHRALRALGVKALRSSRSQLALDTLLRVATGGRSLLGRPRLADPSPEVLAALQVLAAEWSERETVADVLSQARQSREPSVRAAVQEKAP